MGMQDDNSLALIQHREKRVEFGCTKILSIDICCQLNAISLQYVERILRFFDGFRDIGQG